MTAPTTEEVEALAESLVEFPVTHRHTVAAALRAVAQERDALRDRPASIDLPGCAIRELYEACGDDFDCELTVEQRAAFDGVDDDGEPCKFPAGLYAYFTEYPEEGIIGPLDDGRDAT